ncbi:MD-2-related lipid-recognition [Penicillium sp. DV-2018c]|nr:MD-2-related lipid-recognition [Penicillium sp. DV-2018c]KAJ5565710.1 MD-2-related lipid-recognition [Penicillium sp. DV-2018c]
MKFLSAASLLALTAPLANAAAFSLFDPTQTSLKTNDEKFPVKGDNPLQYCAKPDSYKLEIESVDLAPNPPLPGQKLTIAAKGTLLETIEKGATVNLEVKWGLITLIKQTVDLCDELKNVDLECPLEKGHMTLTKEVELPKQIPPGKYSVLADVYNQDQKQVTCLKADDIVFHF